ncbi:hypothetical protein LEP1GSC188_2328 [Leptospira weilii serovar Topaz str. LT2116]|uniref:Uncharacterized protein n=1 Tax=Leptospira weilii serovar Topaz str. LT2116 TaxID=1088540 RepID=M3GZ03_9LEPT|nr:hypothetical protein LEP1GSC188_2328 [Leptospira weilii serovar Topaz str. LT2116]
MSSFRATYLATLREARFEFRKALRLSSLTRPLGSVVPEFPLILGD